MFKKLMFIIFVLALLPVQPAATQENETVLVPRFGDGLAFIRRPDSSDYYFTPRITPDNRYVIAAGGDQVRDVFYRWDISDLADEPITPEADVVGLSDYALAEGNAQPVMITMDGTVIIQLDHHLIQIDIASLEIVGELDLSDLLPPEQLMIFGGLSTNGSIVAARYHQANLYVLWNTETGEVISHTVAEGAGSIRPFRDGWVISQEGDSDTTIYDFCNIDLTSCIREEVIGTWLGEYKDNLIFGDWQRLSTDNPIPTQYFKFDDGLTPIESPFPQLDNTQHIPSGFHGQYMFVRTPIVYEDSPGGMVPRLYTGLWEIDGTAEIRGYGGWRSPFFYGDSFVMNGLNLYDIETNTKLDSFQWERYGIVRGYGNWHPELASLRSLSEDQTLFLFNTGAEAFVGRIEYQPIDDLPQVGDVLFSAERDDYEHVRFSPDGNSILALNGTTLTHWDVNSGEQQTLDLSAYPPIEIDSPVKDDGYGLLLRNEDAFVHVSNVMLRVWLEDLTIIEEHQFEDISSARHSSSYGDADRESVAANGDHIGALFDTTLVVWTENGVIGRSFEERLIRLHPYANGWLIYQYTDASNIIACDLMLTACNTYPVESPLMATDGLRRIATGNIFLFGEPDYQYFILNDGLEEVEPFLSIPKSSHIQTFNEDYAIVFTHGAFGNDRHHQLWSIPEEKILLRLDEEEMVPLRLAGQYQWSGNFLAFSSGDQIGFYHLDERRIRHWKHDAPIEEFALSGDGSRILLVTENRLEVHSVVGLQ